MQDSPDADAILAEVEAALKAGIAPGLQQRMAANAVALARRELAEAPGFAAAERERLVALLGRDGEAAILNTLLADAIRARRIGGDTPGLIGHLWLTTIEKMRVDQPAYPAFAAWRAEQEEDGSRA